MSEQYTELFVITYNGQLTDIINTIESTPTTASNKLLSDNSFTKSNI